MYDGLSTLGIKILPELNQELDRYKKIVLLALLKLTSAAGLIFPIINFYRGLYLFSLIEVITIILFIFMYFRVKSTEDQNKINFYSLAYTVLFLSVMMLAFVISGISKSMFIWAFTIPMISYLLLGIRKGFIVTSVYYSTSTVLLLNNFDIHEFDTITIANVFITAIGFWALAHIYEKANFLSKQKLQTMAIYDTLTGLHNRTMLNQIFNETISTATKENQLISLISFDLDFFKIINDKFGHIVGDQVLIEFSKILKRFTPKNATSFRLGGEEFAIIFSCENTKESIDLAEKIRHSTEKITIEINQQTVTTTTSVGIAIEKPNLTNLTQLLKLSDQRLYHAKSLGRNKVVYEQI